MGTELTLSDIYTRRKRWAIRLVGIVVVLAIVAVGVWIDASNPPLTDSGLGSGGIVGWIAGPVVVYLLLRYTSSNNGKVNPPSGGIVTITIGAAIGSFLTYLIVALALEMISGTLFSASLFSYAGSDTTYSVSTVIAAVLMTIVIPERLVTVEKAGAIEQEDVSSPSHTPSGSTHVENNDTESPKKFDKDLDELLDSIKSSQESADKLIKDGSYECAIEHIQTGLDICREATDINESYQLGRLNEIKAERHRLEKLLEHARKRRDKKGASGRTQGDKARQRAAKLVGTSRDALQKQEFERAASNISEADALLEEAKDEAETDSKQVEADIENVRQRLNDEVRERVQELTAKAEENYEQSRAHLDAGEYEKADESVTDGAKQYRQAADLVQQHDVQYPNALKDIREALLSLNERIEKTETTVAEIEEHQEAVRRAIRSREYDQAEEALRHLRHKVGQLQEFDEAEAIVSLFKSEAEGLEEEIKTKRASQRINGFLGAAGSSRAQAEKLLDEQAYDQAMRRLESALESLEQAEELNDRHELGKGGTINEKREAIQTLLKSASTKPAEELSNILQEAETEIANGIEARDLEDLPAAVESFETAQSHYENAFSLVNKYDLDKQWEVEQRHAMVEEYLETTEEALNDRKQNVRSELEQSLETAESVLHRAEQHIEVNDFVSARESLTEVRSHIDDAAQCLETGLATEQLHDRYTEVSQREKTLRERLPDKGSEGYRTRDLVESLQVLATKLGEPPRPEFVNEYGDFPADAYLETFGSWPEALAAANLEPINEANRKRRSYSRVEVLDAVVDLADELGHAPSKNEMNERGEMSASPVQSRFTDWETALEIASVTDEELEAENDEGETMEVETEEKDKGILGEIEREIKEYEAE